MRKTCLRLLVVLVFALAASWATGGAAQAHSDSCLLAIHIGGIQEHIACF